MDDLAEGVELASAAFEEAGDVAEAFMTADMAKAYKSQLDKIKELSGGEESA
jgi:hypothetical protein